MPNYFYDSMIVGIHDEILKNTIRIIPMKKRTLTIGMYEKICLRYPQLLENPLIIP